MKFVFIEVASEELEARGEKVSRSRLSVATGMHRRDVMRIYDGAGRKETSVSLTTKVIGMWLGSSRFSSRGRKPRVLTLEGDNSEFNSLVRSISTDVHPAAVLFELERVGAVERTPTGVKLIAGLQRTHADPKELFRMYAQDSEELLNALDENAFSEAATPHLHARTMYDNVCIEDLPKIRAWLLKQGSAFHKQIRDFVSRFDLDIRPRKGKTGGGRVYVSSFGRVDEKAPAVGGAIERQ